MFNFIVHSQYYRYIFGGSAPGGQVPKVGELSTEWGRVWRGVSPPQPTRGFSGSISPVVSTPETCPKMHFFCVFWRPQNAPFCTYVLWVRQTVFYVTFGGKAEVWGKITPCPNVVLCLSSRLVTRLDWSITVTVVAVSRPAFYGTDSAFVCCCIYFIVLITCYWLCQAKSKLQDVEAVQNEIVGQAHLENYALKLFLYADNEDRAARFGKYVAFCEPFGIFDACL